MANNELGILLTAKINTGRSIGEINAAISGLEKKVNKLKLKIEVPQNFGVQINHFIKSVEKMKAISDDQNKAIKRVVKEYEDLDGSIKKSIVTLYKNGDQIEETIEKEKKRKSATKKSTEAIKEQRVELEEFLRSQRKFNNLKNVQTRYDDEGKETGSTQTYSDGNSLLRVNLDDQKKVISHTITDRIETEKLIKTKADLRNKVYELAQVGMLSSEQLAKVAKAINTSYDDDGINKAKESLQISQNASKERLSFLKTEHNITEAQAKKMAKWIKDEDSAHYQAFKEKAKREEHLHRLVQDRVEAERLAHIEQEKRNAPIGAGAVRLGSFSQLKGSGVTEENLRSALALSDAYKDLEIRGVKLNHVTGAWTATVKKNARENATLKGVIDRTNGSLYEQEKAISQVNAKNMGALQQLGVAMTRIPVWMAGMTAFYAPIRGLRAAVGTILEIDKQMTGLMRVSGGEIERNKILQESVELSERLGNTIIDINDGIESFARQGFRGDGLIAMTEAATLFSNISDMNVEEASSGLTAILHGFQMLPEEIMRSVDAINEVNVISLLVW